MDTTTAARMNSTRTAPMTMSNSTNSTDNDFSPEMIKSILSQMDDAFAFTILAAIIYLSVLMVVGFLGNLLVCVVYIKRFKVSTTRVFVVALAILDLTSCSLAMPGELLDMRRNFSYDNVVMCKVARMVNTFCSIGSGVVLIAVAVDRFKKICRPLQLQITPHRAKMAVLYSCLVTLLFTWPAAVLYGERTVSTDVPGVTGTDCSTADVFLRTPFPLVYNAILFLVFLGSTITLVTLYTLIWRQVKRQRKFRSSISQGPVSTHTQKISTSSGSGPTGSTEVSEDSGAGSSEHSDAVFTVSYQPGDVDVKETSGSTTSSPGNPSAGLSSVASANSVKLHTSSPLYLNKAERQPWRKVDSRVAVKSALVRKTSSLMAARGKDAHRKMSNQNDSASRKTTFMLFLITMFFVLSYLPHLALMAARAVNTAMLDNLEGAAMAAYNLFLRSYFLQSAVNPLVYSFCNVNFRKECRNLFTGIFSWCTRRNR